MLPPYITDLLEFLDSSTFNLVKLIILGYFGLLWLTIIIWVTRDSIHRSNSLLFQTFSILLNILIPFLGVLLYLIIRPSQTNMERYYDEMEHRALVDNTEDKNLTCENCLTIVDSNYTYCPSCSTRIKKSCSHCNKPFPSVWNICPFCGKDYSVKTTKTKPKITKKKITKTKTITKK